MPAVSNSPAIPGAGSVLARHALHVSAGIGHPEVWDSTAREGSATFGRSAPSNPTGVLAGALGTAVTPSSSGFCVRTDPTSKTAWSLSRFGIVERPERREYTADRAARTQGAVLR